MLDDAFALARRQIQQRQRFVQSLRTAVYSQPDASANADLLRQLAAAEEELRRAQQPTPAQANAPTTVPPGGVLGDAKSGLRVMPTIHMDPLPTGIYHLLDPDADPLLTVVVRNVATDRKPRRVCVKAYIEGLSAEAVRTIKIEPRKDVTLKLLPALFPERARAINEVQRATLHRLR
jgi:hypothetical protein